MGKRLLIVSFIAVLTLGWSGMAADTVLPGMTDTSDYITAGPWLAGRAGLGDTNAWMTMFGLHFRYAIEVKYADFFSDFRVTSCFWNPVQQISDIESLVAQGVDILFVDPAAEAPLVGAVEEAMAQGVPVILASTGVNTDDYVSWVSRDNGKAGFLYADWMGKKLPAGGKVVVLMGIAGSSYAEDVYRGVLQGLSAYPSIQVVGMAYCDWSPVTAKVAMAAFLQANPQIDGVIADGGQMAYGAVEALLDAGRTIPPMTADDWNGWLRIAKEHNIQFVAESGGCPLAVTCVDLAVQVLRGQPVPKIVEYPIVSFEQDELDKYYRPDLSDQYFAINELPEDWILQYYGK